MTMMDFSLTLLAVCTVLQTYWMWRDRKYRGPRPPWTPYR